MKITKTHLHKSGLVLLLLALITSAIVYILSSINGGKTEELNKLQAKLYYSEVIIDKFLLSNIAMKNMLLSTEMSDRYTHFGNLNSLNGAAILYGDSLRPMLTSADELKLFDAHLDNQKQYLATITLIDNNLKAKNQVGAVKLSLTEFDQISKSYYLKANELKKHFEEAKAKLIAESQSNDNTIKTLALISIVLILVLALLVFRLFKMESKAEQSTLKAAFEDANASDNIN